MARLRNPHQRARKLLKTALADLRRSKDHFDTAMRLRGPGDPATREIMFEYIEDEERVRRLSAALQEAEALHNPLPFGAVALAALTGAGATAGSVLASRMFQRPQENPHQATAKKLLWPVLALGGLVLWQRAQS